MIRSLPEFLSIQWLITDTLARINVTPLDLQISSFTYALDHARFFHFQKNMNVRFGNQSTSIHFQWHSVIFFISQCSKEEEKNSWMAEKCTFIIYLVHSLFSIIHGKRNLFVEKTYKERCIFNLFKRWVIKSTFYPKKRSVKRNLKKQFLSYVSQHICLIKGKYIIRSYTLFVRIWIFFRLLFHLKIFKNAAFH